MIFFFILIDLFHKTAMGLFFRKIKLKEKKKN